MEQNQINYSDLLKDAVTKEGKLMEAYRAFHNFSLLNRIYACWQLSAMKKDITPIKTFNQWKEINRQVKKGEKALELCMPVQKTWYKFTDSKKQIPYSTPKEQIKKMLGSGKIEKYNYKDFVFKKYWFALSQTAGEEFKPDDMPKNWNKEKALQELKIKEIPFSSINGNCQGYATFNNEIAINPLAQLPTKTLFHEIAHILLGHTDKEAMADNKDLPINLVEAEAEATALLVLESLGLEGSCYCRGYIQSWYKEKGFPEKSAQKIISVADKILKAGA
ncbi:MAG: ArdC-like ssDNA-binding domain-containing protein [bacterium]